MSEQTICQLDQIFLPSVSGEWGSEPRGENDVIVLRAADFTKDCKLKHEVGVPRSIPNARLASRVLKNGDILVETSGGSPDQPTGRIVLFDREDESTIYSFSNFLQLLRSKAEVEPLYMYYLLYFRYTSGRILRYQQQTTGIINFKLEQYLKEKVSIPNLPTQRKIARILQTIDRAIEKTEALIEKYQQIKAGLMHDLFTRGIGPDGQLRPPREQAPELYKEAPIGWIPNEWDVTGILDICSEVFLGLTTKVDYVEDGGVPLVRATNIAGGKLSFSKTLNISHAQHRELTRYRQAKFGDVLISKSGSLGVCALVDDKREFSIYESIIVLQPKPQELESGYLLWLMREEATQRRLLGETVGSTVGHLNLLDFRQLDVPKVPILEQRLIEKAMDSVQRKLDSFAEDLSKLQKQKSGLMHDLLTGKVPVKTGAEQMELSNI